MITDKKQRSTEGNEGNGGSGPSESAGIRVIRGDEEVFERLLVIGWPTLGGWNFLVRLSEPELMPGVGRVRYLSATNDEGQAQRLSQLEARVLLPVVQEQRPAAHIMFAVAERNGGLG